MSDNGSDHNTCHSESTPCRNLQTVFNRAEDNAQILITSPTLSLDFQLKPVFSYWWRREILSCEVSSNISFWIGTEDDTTVSVECLGWFSSSKYLCESEIAEKTKRILSKQVFFHQNETVSYIHEQLMANFDETIFCTLSFSRPLLCMF